MDESRPNLRVITDHYPLSTDIKTASFHPYRFHNPLRNCELAPPSAQNATKVFPVFAFEAERANPINNLVSTIYPIRKGEQRTNKGRNPGAGIPGKSGFLPGEGLLFYGQLMVRDLFLKMAIY
jgi:hypothetical protein